MTPSYRHALRVCAFLLILALGFVASSSRADITIIVTADTHYGSTVADSSQQFQINAINRYFSNIIFFDIVRSPASSV